MRALVALALVSSAACGGGGSGDGGGVPTATELYGLWLNIGGGSVHGLVFAQTSAERPELAGKSPTYLLYLYPENQPSALVQAGTYTIGRTALNEGSGQVTGDALITTVAWSTDLAVMGKTFGNGIEAFDGDSFVLRGTSDGNRTYAMATALP